MWYFGIKELVCRRRKMYCICVQSLYSECKYTEPNSNISTSQYLQPCVVIDYPSSSFVAYLFFQRVANNSALKYDTALIGISLYLTSNQLIVLVSICSIVDNDTL